ncbi:MAG: choice-of-anchor Q domain-containing protein [Acidobacteriota bacterium]
MGGGSGNGAIVSVTDSLFIDNEAGDEGGAIERSDSSGVSEIRNTIFRNNRSAALDSGGGGALANNSSSGRVTLIDCLFEQNQSLGRGGGALFDGSGSEIIISGTSFLHNLAAEGGGLAIDDGDSAFLTNSTLSGNQASLDGGGAWLDDSSQDFRWVHVTATDNRAIASGGGVFVSRGNVYLANSIVAENFEGAAGDVPSDCQVGPEFPKFNELRSGGFNILGALNTCVLIGDTASDLNGVDPMLSSVGTFGCASPLPDGTCPPLHALDLLDPAVDQGSCTVSGVSTDQRGLSRPVVVAMPTVGDGCDIGAYEARDDDLDAVEDGVDNCPMDNNPAQTDTDQDTLGDACDLCEGVNSTGDGDADSICADRDCDDSDGLGISCGIFFDGFESGDLTAWSDVVQPLVR